MRYKIKHRTTKDDKWERKNTLISTKEIQPRTS